MSLRSRLRLVLLAIAAWGLLAADATPAAAERNQFVRMTGAQEVPGPGDPNGRGGALINLLPQQGRVCGGVRFNNISEPATGLHIHEGSRGEDGPIVVNLDPLLAGNRCVDGIPTETIQEIRENPFGFYLNLHNFDFPAGAIRGQLNPSDVPSGFAHRTGPRFPFALMNGAQEVPGPGDPDGRGTAFFILRPAAGEVCADMRWRAIDPATGIHIHRGARGEDGPVVVGFLNPGPGTRCVSAASSLVREIRDNLADFYINVHTMPFPAGAIRGQLEPSIEPPRSE